MRAHMWTKAGRGTGRKTETLQQTLHSAQSPSCGSIDRDLSRKESQRLNPRRRRGDPEDYILIHTDIETHTAEYPQDVNKDQLGLPEMKGEAVYH